MVADVIDIAKDLKRDHRNDWGPGAKDMVVGAESMVSRWYVRMDGTVEQARQIFGEVQPLTRAGAPEREAAFLTGAMTENEVQDKLAKFQVSSVLRVLG